MEFVFENAVGSSCFAACALASGVAGLEDEVFDDAVEDDVVVVALETELDKGTACLWGFFREEFNVQRAHGCFDEDASCGERLNVVLRRHGKNSDDADQQHKMPQKNPPIQADSHPPRIQI